MISIIAAIGDNNELGKNNELIWKIPEDLLFFKNVTTNHTIIMGYNTYLSLRHPLRNRKNVVITSKDLPNKNIVVYKDINELIANEITNNEECFIIGGESLYKYFYHLSDKMYITKIHKSDSEADTFFPNIEESEWEKEKIMENKYNDIEYERILYKRLKNE